MIKEPADWLTARGRGDERVTVPAACLPACLLLLLHDAAAAAAACVPACVLLLYEAAAAAATWVCCLSVRLHVCRCMILQHTCFMVLRSARFSYYGMMLLQLACCCFAWLPAPAAWRCCILYASLMLLYCSVVYIFSSAAHLLPACLRLLQGVIAFQSMLLHDSDSWQHLLLACCRCCIALLSAYLLLPHDIFCLPNNLVLLCNATTCPSAAAWCHSRPPNSALYSCLAACCCCSSCMAMLRIFCGLLLHDTITFLCTSRRCIILIQLLIIVSQISSVTLLHGTKTNYYCQALASTPLHDTAW